MSQKSGEVYFGGWRPAIGWTGVLGLAFQLIVAPAVGIPPVPWEQLTSLMGSVAAIALGRSYEKGKGAARETWGEK